MKWRRAPTIWLLIEAVIPPGARIEGRTSGEPEITIPL